MEEINTERIIGDCMEINAEIVEQRFTSKLPKFIARIREKYYRDKLIKIITKLKVANKPLTSNNLFEFFIYLYNNYPPKGSYKDIGYSVIIESSNRLIAKITGEKWDGQIKIDLSDLTKFELYLTVYKEVNLNTYNFTLKELTVSLEEVSDYVSEMNTIILNNMSDYIIEYLSRFNNNGEEK